MDREEKKKNGGVKNRQGTVSGIEGPRQEAEGGKKGEGGGVGRKGGTKDWGGKEAGEGSGEPGKKVDEWVPEVTDGGLNKR